MKRVLNFCFRGLIILFSSVGLFQTGRLLRQLAAGDWRFMPDAICVFDMNHCNVAKYETMTSVYFPDNLWNLILYLEMPSDETDKHPLILEKLIKIELIAEDGMVAFDTSGFLHFFHDQSSETHASHASALDFPLPVDMCKEKYKRFILDDTALSQINYEIAGRFWYIRIRVDDPRIRRVSLFCPYLRTRKKNRNSVPSLSWMVAQPTKTSLIAADTVRPVTTTQLLNRVSLHQKNNQVYSLSFLINTLSVSPTSERNAAANELFSLPELPNGVVADLARMFRSTDEDEVWRDYCLQFLGSALEREGGVTDADHALARETLVEALSSTNATFAGTALRALRRVNPSDPLVASNALRIARDPSYPSSSRTTALLVLEECVRAAGPRGVAGPQVAGPKSILPDGEPSTLSTSSTLAEIATAISADPTASPLLRRTAEAVARRHAADAD